MAGLSAGQLVMTRAFFEHKKKKAKKKKRSQLKWQSIGLLSQGLGVRVPRGASARYYYKGWQNFWFSKPQFVQRSKNTQQVQSTHIKKARVYFFFQRNSSSRMARFQWQGVCITELCGQKKTIIRKYPKRETF